MMKKQLITGVFVLAVVIIIGTLVYKFSFYDRPKISNEENLQYKYEIRLDPDRLTGVYSILIYKKNIQTNLGSSHSAIGDTDLYIYIHDHYGLSEAKVGKVIDISLTPEYIEGLSADGKFVSGKLIDPATKKQIGHWTYDLNKKDFSEFNLNFSK